MLPDLIDQPLCHLLFDLPSTRTLGHSLLFTVPLCLAVLVVARRSSLPDAIGTGFSVGLVSHPLADAVRPLVLGKHAELGFLLWPVVDSPPYVGQKPLFSVGDVLVTTLWFVLPHGVIALVAWRHDGYPGIARLGQ